MKQALTLAVCIFCMMHIAEAQIQKTLHQAFEIEGANLITLNIEGEYQIDKWAGNAILVETHIELYDASPSILKHVLDQGRYMLEVNVVDNGLHVQSKEIRKRPIHKNGSQCYEIVNLRLLIPEEFNIVDHQTLERIRESQSTTTTSTQKEE